MGEAAGELLLPLHRLVQLLHSPVQLGDGLLHLFRHGVEVRGYGSDFVIGADPHPAGKIASGNGSGGPGEPAQRGRQQPRHRVGQRRA